MLRDEEHLKLLRAIADLGLIGYPYQEDDPGSDPMLIMALGVISGTAMKAIADYHERHSRPQKVVSDDPEE
jgi:hypothetical protein